MNDKDTWYASTSGNSTTGASGFIGFDGGLYRTTDHGSSWTQICTTNDLGGDIWNVIHKIFADPINPDILYVATNNGLFRSTNCLDATPTWSIMLNGIVYDIEHKPGSTSSKLYITVYSNSQWSIMESQDYGSSWSSLSNQPELNAISLNNKGSFTIEVSKAKPDFLYCISRMNLSGKLFYNDLSSSTGWVQVANDLYPQFGSGNSFGVNQAGLGEDIFVSGNYDDINDEYDGTYGTLFNTGNTSHPEFYTTHVDIEDIVCYPYNDEEVWVAHHGGVDKTTNNFTTKESKNSGLNVAMVMRMGNSYMSADLTTIGLYHDGSAITSQTYQYPWSPSWINVAWGDGMRTLVDYTDDNRIFVSSQYGSWTFSDDRFVQNTSYELHRSSWQTEAAMNQFDPSILYVIGDNSSTTTSKSIYRTDNEFGNQVKITSSIDFSNYTDYLFWQVFPSNANEDHLYATLLSNSNTNCYLYRTTNSNVSLPFIVQWNKLPIPDITRGISSIYTDPDNENIVYLVYSGCENAYAFPSCDGLIYRIDYTDIANPVFDDITYDLPFAFTGSDCIEQMRSVDNSIYLSTDIGVFYNNDYLSNTLYEWRKIGENLPHVSIYGMDINYPSSTIRVGTMGRGVWEAGIPCEKFSENYYLIQDETWSGYMIINRDVYIPQGITLTIDPGAEIKFLSGVKLVVERGGKLIVNGGTLTSACDAMWAGVEVWGNSSASQLTSGAQGEIELINGAVLANASDAINLIKMSGSTPDWSYTGGIVTIDDAIIRNCDNGINFMSYHNYLPSNPSVTISNSSMIEDCIFETTTELMDNDGIPYAFVNLYDVEGVYMKGCTFQNTNEEATTATDLGIGIIAYDASFYVVENSSSEPCIFESLYYGVKQINTNTSHASVINTAIFNDNYFAAYFSGATGTTVVKSEFNIEKTISYGVYLDQCNAWQLEENSFDGTTSLNTFGVVVNNSGAVNNEIYNNTFSNLKYGIEAIDKNRGVSIRPIGLKIKCNDFSSCTKDIFITQNGTCSPCGIAYVQGSNTSVTSPAGNTFSHTGPANQYTDIDNVFSSYPILYCRHTGTSVSWIPLYYRNLTEYPTSYTYSKSTACPSSFGGSASKLQIASLQDIESRIDSL